MMFIFECSISFVWKSDSMIWLYFIANMKKNSETIKMASLCYLFFKSDSQHSLSTSVFIEHFGWLKDSIHYTKYMSKSLIISFPLVFSYMKKTTKLNKMFFTNTPMSLLIPTIQDTLSVTFLTLYSNELNAKLRIQMKEYVKIL